MRQIIRGVQQERNWISSHTFLLLLWRLFENGVEIALKQLSEICEKKNLNKTSETNPDGREI
jgi:hypothetical protein